MPDRTTSKSMYASLHYYLDDLLDSGVEGIPISAPSAKEPAENVPSPNDENQAITLSDLAAEVAACQRCGLATERRQAVFGQGCSSPRLVLVGEAPGAEEDRLGQPFVGDAGKVLNRLLGAMGLSRDEVYICNVIKCRPPNNRNPHKDEIVACSHYLKQQLILLKPDVMVALGTFAAQTLLGNKEPISRLRGKLHPMPGFEGLMVMPTFHPAFLLRNQDNKEHFWEVWGDMSKVLAHLGLPVPDKKRR